MEAWIIVLSKIAILRPEDDDTCYLFWPTRVAAQAWVDSHNLKDYEVLRACDFGINWRRSKKILRESVIPRCQNETRKKKHQNSDNLGDDHDL